MTSEPSRAFVWFRMPGATEPVVVGRLDRSGEVTSFTYGRNYLGQARAVPLYLPELPLEDRVLMPLSGMSIAGCIADSGPDAWGQRVIMAKHAAALRAPYPLRPPTSSRLRRLARSSITRSG